MVLYVCITEYILYMHIIVYYLIFLFKKNKSHLYVIFSFFFLIKISNNMRFYDILWYIPPLINNQIMSITLYTNALPSYTIIFILVVTMNLPKNSNNTTLGADEKSSLCAAYPPSFSMIYNKEHSLSAWLVHVRDVYLTPPSPSPPASVPTHVGVLGKKGDSRRGSNFVGRSSFVPFAVRVSII